MLFDKNQNIQPLLRLQLSLQILPRYELSSLKTSYIYI